MKVYVVLRRYSWEDSDSTIEKIFTRPDLAHLYAKQEQHKDASRSFYFYVESGEVEEAL